LSQKNIIISKATFKKTHVTKSCWHHELVCGFVSVGTNALNVSPFFRAISR